MFRYNAESTVSPDGKKIIFTSTRDKDLELYVLIFRVLSVITTPHPLIVFFRYTMDIDGKNVERITYTPGYDGGAYFSFNSKMITWRYVIYSTCMLILTFRANRPRGGNLTDYLNLLQLGLVRPENMQIYVMDMDTRQITQLTNNDATNFAPFFLPDDSGKDLTLV